MTTSRQLDASTINAGDNIGRVKVGEIWKKLITLDETSYVSADNPTNPTLVFGIGSNKSNSLLVYGEQEINAIEIFSKPISAP